MMEANIMATNESIVREVTELSRTLFQMGSAMDLDTLFAHYDEDTVYLHNGKSVEWEQHQEQMRALFGSLAGALFEPLDFQVFPMGPEAALWTGRYRYELKQRTGEVITGKGAQTWVFRRSGGKWLIMHVHESDEAAP